MDEDIQKSADELIDKGKWAEFLFRFVNVLRINIAIVDTVGRIIVPPFREGDHGLYGSDFLTATFDMDFSGKGSFVWSFEQKGAYWEIKDGLDFHAFAIPIKIEADKIIAYLVVGPVILNKRRDQESYLADATRLNMNISDLVDHIQEIRVVSFLTIKSVLDLLAEVVKDVIEIRLEKQKLHKKRFEKEVLAKQIVDAAQDMYATIHLDEMLVTILDVAMNLTGAEGGSIMIVDEDKQHLTIKVSRGLDQAKIKATRVRLGEGIAGMAAQSNEPFIIQGSKGSNRIQHLLKRPEIKQSVILPLSSHDQVLGVLNLHTKSEEHKIDANVESIKYLSRLITTAINSL